MRVEVTGKPFVVTDLPAEARNAIRSRGATAVDSFLHQDDPPAHRRLDGWRARAGRLRADPGRTLLEGAGAAPVRGQAPPVSVTISSIQLEPFGPVRDQEHGPARGRVEHVVDQRLRGLRVEVRGRLVEEEHRRVGEQRARERQPLSLTAREPPAVLADERVEPVRQRLDPVVEPRPAERLLELVVGRAAAARAAGSRGSSSRRDARPGPRARTSRRTSSCR